MFCLSLRAFPPYLCNILELIEFLIIVFLLNYRNLSKEKAFVTDVTNASRTMLMNIKTLKWDPKLCDFFGVAEECLPNIKSSAEIYGHINYQNCPLPDTIPIAGCLGDQQAALVNLL